MHSELTALAGKTVKEVLVGVYSTVILRCSDGANLRVDNTNDGAEFQWVDEEMVSQWIAVDAAYRKQHELMAKLWEFHRRAVDLPESERVPFGFGGFFRCPGDDWADASGAIAFMERYKEISQKSVGEAEKERLLAEIMVAA